MKKFKVKTPNESFAGKRHGVRFFKGEAVAELTDEVVKEFMSWGYSVEEIKEKKQETPKKAPQKKQTKKSEK